MAADNATESTTAFAAPSAELVRNAIRELEWGERLVVHKMAAGHGSVAVDVYSFPQLVTVLFQTRWDELLVEGSKAEIMWVDAPTVCAWLRDVIGDVEFADAVEEALSGADYYMAQIEAIRPLFVERVDQYKSVLNPEQAQ